MKPTVIFQRISRSLTKTMTPAAAALLLLLLLSSGCQTTGITTIFKSRQTAGFPPLNSRILSRISAEKRSEFPEQNLSLLPKKERPALRDEEVAPPSLSLEGKSLGSPEAGPFELKLYTDKTAYTTGRVEILPQNDESSEAGVQTWQIIAFDNLGDADDDFEYIYLLGSEKDEEFRYLVVNGGEYQNAGQKYRGFEGTLIRPAAGNNIAEPLEVVKIDFGFKLRVPPRHIDDIELAEDISKSLRKEVATIKKLKSRQAELTQNLEQLQAREVPEQSPKYQQELAKKQQKTTALEKELTNLKLDLDLKISSAQNRFGDYFVLRQGISESYAEFRDSNQYHWLPPSDQEDHQKIYSRMEKTDQELTASYTEFLNYSREPEELAEKYNEMMDKIGAAAVKQ